MPLPTIFFCTNTGEQSDYAKLIQRVRQETNIPRFNFQFRTITCTTSHSLEILRQIETYRDEISFFYFGGREEHFRALLDACYRDHRGSLFDYLARLPNLDLIFLNACSQDAFIDPFLERRIEVVVGTAQQLPPGQATAFATTFCQQFLLHGGTTQAAYEQGRHAMNRTSGQEASQLTELRGNPQFRLRWGWRGEAEVASPMIGASAPSSTPMPPRPATLPRPKRPFAGTRPYCSQEAPVFFGRDAEVAQLYHHLTTITTQPVIVLYGQSGVGKTSLLKAGLLPRVEQQFCRYYFNGRETASLYQALCRQVQPIDQTQIVWRDWVTWLANQDRNLLLIVDQVEPQLLSAQPRSQADFTSFMQAVATLVATPISGKKPRVIFSVREGNLAQCQAFLAQAHLQNYVDYISLKALNHQGIGDILSSFVAPSAITNDYQFAIEGEVAQQIVRDLLHDRDSTITPFLQAILVKLWKEADYTDDGLRRLSWQRYEQFYRSGRLLHEFLQECLEQACRHWPPIIERKAVAELLLTYVSPLTSSGRRTATGNAALPLVTTRLQDSYLLTTRAGEQDGALYLGHRMLAMSTRLHYRLMQKRSWFSRTSNGLFFWLEQLLVKLFPQRPKAAPAGQYSPESRADCEKRGGRSNPKGCLHWLVVLLVIGLLLRFYPFIQTQWQAWREGRTDNQQTALPFVSSSMATNVPDAPLATPLRQPELLQSSTGLELKPVSRLYATDALPIAYPNRRGSVLAFSSDAALLFAGGGDNTLEAWSVASSQGHPSLLLPTDNNAPVTTINIQGNLLIYTTATGMVGHVRLDALGYIEPLQRDEPIELLHHQGAVTAIQVSADGNLLVTGGEDGALYQYDLSTRQAQPFRRDPANPITAVALHHNNEMIAYAGANQVISLLARSTRAVVPQLTGHTGRVNFLEFSPDGAHLLSASSDGSVCIWQVANGVRDYCFVDLTAPANIARYSPDGTLIIAAREDGFLWIWDAASYRLLDTVAAHPGGVSALAIRTDGRQLATIGWNSDIVLWDITLPLRSLQ